MKQLTLFVFFILIVFFPVTLFSQKITLDLESTILTRVSGEAGTMMEWNSPITSAVSFIEIGETGDKPCAVSISARVLPGNDRAGEITIGGTNRVLKMDCPPRFLDVYMWDLSKGAGFPLYDSYYIGKIQTIPSKLNDKIKGLKVYGRKFKSSSTGPPLVKSFDDVVDEFKRTNASKNKNNTIACPSNTLISGIIGHFSSKGLVGIQCKCSELLYDGLSLDDYTEHLEEIERERIESMKAEINNRPWCDKADFYHSVTGTAWKPEVMQEWRGFKEKRTQYKINGVYKLVLRKKNKGKILAETEINIKQEGRQIKAFVKRGLDDWDLPIRVEMRGYIDGNKLCLYDKYHSKIEATIQSASKKVKAKFTGKLLDGRGSNITTFLITGKSKN